MESDESEEEVLALERINYPDSSATTSNGRQLTLEELGTNRILAVIDASNGAATISELSKLYHEVHGVSLEDDLEKYFGLHSTEEFLDSDAGNDLLQVSIVVRKKKKLKNSLLVNQATTRILSIEGGLKQLLDVLTFCGGYAYQAQLEQLFVKRFGVTFDNKWIAQYFEVANVLSFSAVPDVISKITVSYDCKRGFVFCLKEFDLEQGGVVQFKYVLEACGGFAKQTEIKQKFMELLCTEFDKEWRWNFFGNFSRKAMTKTSSFKCLMWGTDCYDEWIWWLVDTSKPKDVVQVVKSSEQSQEPSPQLQNVGLTQLTDALRLIGGLATRLELERQFFNVFAKPLDGKWLMKHFNQRKLRDLINLPVFNNQIISIVLDFENMKVQRYLLRDNLVNHGSNGKIPDVKLLKAYSGLAEILYILKTFGKTMKLDIFTKEFKESFDTDFDVEWMINRFDTKEIFDLRDNPLITKWIKITKNDDGMVVLELIHHVGAGESQETLTVYSKENEAHGLAQLVDMLKSFGGSANHLMLKKYFAVRHTVEFSEKWLVQHFNKNSFSELNDVPSVKKMIKVVSGSNDWYYFTLLNYRVNPVIVPSEAENSEAPPTGSEHKKITTPPGKITDSTGVLLLTEYDSTWICNDTELVEHSNDLEDTIPNSVIKPKQGLPQLLYALNFFSGIASIDQLRKCFEANGIILNQWAKHHFGVETPELLTEHPDVASKIRIVNKCDQAFLQVNDTTFVNAGIAQMKICLKHFTSWASSLPKMQNWFEGKFFTEFGDTWAETYFDTELASLNQVSELTEIVEIRRKTRLYRLRHGENPYTWVDKAEIDRKMKLMHSFNLDTDDMISIKKTDCDNGDDFTLPPHYEAAYLLKTLTPEQIKEGISQIVDVLVDGGGMVPIIIVDSLLDEKLNHSFMFERLLHSGYVDYMTKFGDFDSQVEILYSDNCYLLVKKSEDWKKVETRVLAVLDFYNGQCTEGQFGTIYHRMYGAYTIFHKYLDNTLSHLTPGLISVTKLPGETCNRFDGPKSEKYIGRQRILKVVLKNCGGIAGMRKLRQFYYKVYNVSLLDDLQKYFGTNQIDKLAPLIQCNTLFLRDGHNEKEFVHRPQCYGFYEDIAWKAYNDDLVPPGQTDEEEFTHTSAYVSERVETLLQEMGGQASKSRCFDYLEDGMGFFDFDFGSFLFRCAPLLLKELVHSKATFRDDLLILTPTFEDKLVEVILEIGGQPTLEQVQSKFHYIYKTDFNEAWQERFPGVISIAQLADHVPKKIRITKHNSIWIFEAFQPPIKQKFNEKTIGYHQRGKFINHLLVIVNSCGGDALLEQVSSTYKKNYHLDFEKTWRDAFPACNSLADVAKRVDKKVRITQYRSTWRFRLGDWRTDSNYYKKNKRFGKNYDMETRLFDELEGGGLNRRKNFK